MSQDWDSVAVNWVNSRKGNWTYNPDKTTYQTTFQQLNVALAMWENNSRVTYTYSGTGKILTRFIESWNTTQWVSSSRDISTYDENDYLINELSQYWNLITWVNSLQGNYINNSDGTLFEAVLQQWDPNANAWVNDARTTYHYKENCLLPLTLVSFTASRSGATNILHWNTTNEMNASHFEIERSSNGRNFSAIGRVAAKEQMKNDYSFTDAHPLGGVNFYRLKQVDKDGRFNYSNIASVEVTVADYKLYPNPVKDILHIENLKGNATLSIIAQDGRMVDKKIVAGNTYEWNVKSLSTGTYYVRIEEEGKVSVVKFLKEE